MDFLHSDGQVKFSEMEVNSVGKPLMITESTCACFDDFDSAVNAFRRAVSHLVLAAFLPGSS